MIQKLTTIASILIPFPVAVAFGTAAYEEFDTAAALLRVFVAIAAAVGYIAAGIVSGHLTIEAYRKHGIWYATLPLIGVVTVFFIGYRNVHGLARDLIFLEPILYLVAGVAAMLSDDSVDLSSLVDGLKKQNSRLQEQVSDLEEQRDGFANQESDLQAMQSRFQKQVSQLQTNNDGLQAINDDLQAKLEKAQTISGSSAMACKNLQAENNRLATLTDERQAKLEKLQAKLEWMQPNCNRWTMVKDRMNTETFETLLVFIGEQTETQAVERGLQKRNIVNRIRSWSA